jgi:dihydrofolate reductase
VLKPEKQICLIAAMGRNRVIGVNGKMPWHLPGELKHFKSTTMGKPMLMGRKTWESIGRPLPGRQNIVISRNPALAIVGGVELAGTLQQALQMAHGAEAMVIGGGELYRQALPLASRMVLTLVDCMPAGDTFFPDWNSAHWQEISRFSKAADELNPYGCEILELRRIARSN